MLYKDKETVNQKSKKRNNRRLDYSDFSIIALPCVKLSYI